MEQIAEIEPREDRVMFSRGFLFWGDQSEAANRLISVNILNAQPTTVADTIKMTYDGFGRRVGITELHGATTITSNSFSFVWCGTNLCQERDSSGVTVIKRFYKLGEQWVTGTNAGNYYFNLDKLGSVREMVDSMGTLRARYDYDPYGRQFKSPGGTLDADFGYTGFYMERAAGLDLTWFRAYDTDRGRWLSRDPLGEFSGINLYSYVGNDPFDWIDPWGLCDIPVKPQLLPLPNTGNPSTGGTGQKASSALAAAVVTATNTPTISPKPNKTPSVPSDALIYGSAGAAKILISSATGAGIDAAVENDSFSIINEYNNALGEANEPNRDYTPGDYRTDPAANPFLLENPFGYRNPLYPPTYTPSYTPTSCPVDIK